MDDTMDDTTEDTMEETSEAIIGWHADHDGELTEEDGHVDGAVLCEGLGADRHARPEEEHPEDDVGDEAVERCVPEPHPRRGGHQ